jgi:uroporphyrinogen decarboxylase
VLKEFGYYSLDRWIREGNLDARDAHADYDAYLRGVFGYDEPAIHGLGGLGWCEAGFVPAFESKTLEDRGDTELVQDAQGRKLLCFKGRRSGFMPEYVDHPVKDMATWESLCRWRMDPATPSRLEQATADTRAASIAQRAGKWIQFCLVGGYMYLRSLVGPMELLYMFYDDPDVIHSCMRQWLLLADSISAIYQKDVVFDEVFFGEDVCYNHGPLISPDMMKEFLFPYYQQLLDGIKHRQRDTRKLHVQIDTDGDCRPVIPYYADAVGADMFSPFEVASGCDVVDVGNRYPDLRISGGIDKRVLAASPAEIDAMLERIIPAMRKRGGYIPTCDHGVPEEVSFGNFVHYRKRLAELAV